MLRQVKAAGAFPAETQTWGAVSQPLESGRNHRNVWGLKWAEKAGEARSCKV